MLPRKKSDLSHKRPTKLTTKSIIARAELLQSSKHITLSEVNSIMEDKPIPQSNAARMQNGGRPVTSNE